MAGRLLRAALGFRAHTGWAAMVAAAGPLPAPAILQRRRVEMIAGSSVDPPRFVYHAAAKLDPAAAAEVVEQGRKLADRQAAQALAAAVAELRAAGYQV